MIRNLPPCTKSGDLIVGNSPGSAQFLIDSRLTDASRDKGQTCYELGIAYSCGTGGVEVDLVQAHKWFNLAALAGSEEGQALRTEVAEEMTAREIAEAQRQARAFLRGNSAPMH